MIRSEHMKSCLTAQMCFMHFKGQGTFKKNFKIGGNVDELKAYRLIPLTPPLFFHFTLPLRNLSKDLPTSHTLRAGRQNFWLVSKNGKIFDK
jgi:hypothetical protein